MECRKWRKIALILLYVAPWLIQESSATHSPIIIWSPAFSHALGSLVTRVFPRFRLFDRFYFDFSLVHGGVSLSSAWPSWLLWFRFLTILNLKASYLQSAWIFTICYRSFLVYPCFLWHLLTSLKYLFHSNLFKGSMGLKWVPFFIKFTDLSVYLFSNLLCPAETNKQKK